MTEKSTTSTFDFQKKFIETKNIAMVGFFLVYLILIRRCRTYLN
jgi:hypothetical protein